MTVNISAQISQLESSSMENCDISPDKQALLANMILITHMPQAVCGNHAQSSLIQCRGGGSLHSKWGLLPRRGRSLVMRP